MTSEILNQELLNLYIERLPKILETIRDNATNEQLENTHGPFMMHVYPEYVAASKKIMFVGMETHGWEKCHLEEEHSLTHQRLTGRYESFMSKSEEPNSPFWWFIKNLNDKYGQTDLNKTVLWTNLSKIDVSKNRPTGDLYNNSMADFLDLLIEEVKIVKPDILILMTTNPNYQWHMKQNFGLETGLSQREELIPKQLLKWTSDKLPDNTFQICHPNSLRFKKGGFTQNAAQIIEKIHCLVSEL